MEEVYTLEDLNEEKEILEEERKRTLTEMEEKLWYWGEQIERLFDKYPIMKDICKGLKKNQYPAAIYVAGGLMMTLMTRCTYHFYHRPEEARRLNCALLVIGEPTSGKSFATRLYKILSEPIAVVDKKSKDAINAWREIASTLGVNKDKPKKPKVPLRIHPVRTGNRQFVTDMTNSVEVIDSEEMQLHMLTFDTELDNTLRVQRGGQWINKHAWELKAFHNEEDGMFFANNDSTLETFNVTWNYIYTGTPLALKQKVNAENFGTGLPTRLTCIPLPCTHFEMIDNEKTPDYDSDERLRQWAYLLDRVKGELPYDKLVDELFDWTSRRMADAKDDDSKAEEMLCKRCAYHGLNYSAPFIVMRHWNEMRQDGQYYQCDFETDDTDWELCSLLTNIHWGCQKYFFMGLAEQYFDDQKRNEASMTRRYLKTIRNYDRLPEVFVNEDVERCFGLRSESARTKIKRWVKDHVVAEVGVMPGSAHKKVYRKMRLL